MKLVVSELSVLMKAAEHWRNSSKDNVYYAKVNKGKPSFSESSENSFASIKSCKDLSRIISVDSPTYYVEWPSGKTALFLPDSWENSAPLEGRPYCPSKFNCYTLAQDYYKITYGITLPEMNEDLDSLKNDWHPTFFNENKELSSNWEMTISPEKGDAVFFAIGHIAFENKKPNHCGIYLGDGKLLHHHFGRISNIEPLEDWSHWVISYVRNKHV